MLWFKQRVHPSEPDLSAYVDGELPPSRSSRVEAHVAACEVCRETLEGLRATRALLAALPRQVPSRSLALGPEHARESRTAPRPARGLLLAPVLTFCLLVALVGVDAFALDD